MSRNIATSRPCKAEVGLLKGCKWLGPTGVMTLGCPSRCFFRMGAASGAVAMMMGAYGAHGAFKNKEPGDETEKLKLIYFRAHAVHLAHSLALLIVPMTGRPCVTGGLWTFGTMLFSGSLYCKALTGNEKCTKVAPFGGGLLILGWITAAIL